MKFRIKNTSRTIKVIGLYQIIGSILGIGIISWLMLSTETINGPLLFIFTLALFLYGFSFKSGYLLLEESSIKKGLIFSIISQVIQMVFIGFGEYSFEFVSGLTAYLGFNITNDFVLTYGASLSSFDITINSSTPEYFVNINIVGIFILIVLADIYKEIYTPKVG